MSWMENMFNIMAGAGIVSRWKSVLYYYISSEQQYLF